MDFSEATRDGDETTRWEKLQSYIAILSERQDVNGVFGSFSTQGFALFLGSVVAQIGISRLS